MTAECPHSTLRALSVDGVCVLCPPPMATLDATARQRLGAQLTEQARRASAVLDKRHLGRFVQNGWHVIEGTTRLEWNWHHEAFCATLQGILLEWLRARRGEAGFIQKIRRAVINLCPTSLKSRIMVFACAWMWLHDPSWKVAYVSGNPEVLSTCSLAHRDLVMSQWYRERFGIKWRIRPDLDRVNHWGTTVGGERISRGIDSAATGLHVDCVLCDDPDDAHDVHSEAARRKVKGKWRAFSNRFNRPFIDLLIVVQQRVHPDDLSAACIALGYYHVSFPLEYNSKHRADSPWYADPRTVDGEILHAVRFTPEYIAELKVVYGTAGFQAQYNQRPEAFEGALLKRVWFRFFRLGKADDAVQAWIRPEGCNEQATRVIERKPNGKPDFDRVVMSVDASFGSLSESASRVSISVYGMKGADRFVLFNSAKRRTPGDTITAIGNIYEQFSQITKVLIEKKANGAAVISRFEGAISGIIPIEPEGGKEARAAAAQPAVEAGNVYLLEGAPWLTSGEEPDDAGWLDEVCSFPHGRKDDRVDDFSQMMNHYADKDRGAWRRVNWGV